MGLKEFRKEVLKANNKHKYKVTNSNGTKAAWRWIKKNKWLNIGQPITELEFGTIIKAINKTLQDQLVAGKDVLFPNRMGRLEIRKFTPKKEFKDGKVVTTLPVDWKKTIELWWEDEESYKAKTLVRQDVNEVFTFYYNKNAKYAHYTNKSFYQFIPTRYLKKRIKQKVLNKSFDALLLNKNNELY